MPAPLTPPLQSADIRLLTELGFVATAAGLNRQATTIFEGLREIRPHRAFPYIGLATTLLNEGQVESAESVLKQGRTLLACVPVSALPEDEAATHAEDLALLASFHGLALQLCARTAQAQRALGDALHLQADGSAARLARVMLGQPEQGHAGPLESTTEKCA